MSHFNVFSVCLNWTESVFVLNQCTLKWHDCLVNSPQDISTDKQSQTYHTQTFEIVSHISPDTEEITVSNEAKPVPKVSMARSREQSSFISTNLMAEHHEEMMHSVIHKPFHCHSPVSADMLTLPQTDTISQK